MPTNKNALVRYQILDRCFSDFRHKYTIDDLIDQVNHTLLDLCGTEISLRQIREDIKYMRDLQAAHPKKIRGSPEKICDHAG